MQLLDDPKTKISNAAAAAVSSSAMLMLTMMMQLLSKMLYTSFRSGSLEPYLALEVAPTYNELNVVSIAAAVVCGKALSALAYSVKYS